MNELLIELLDEWINSNIRILQVRIHKFDTARTISFGRLSDQKKFFNS